MKAGWLIYDQEGAKRNKAFISWFMEETKQQPLTMQLVYWESLQFGIKDNKLTCWLNGEEAVLPDFAIVRTIDPSLNERLELFGVRCFNNAAVSHLANDKARTYAALQALDIPMLNSQFAAYSAARKPILPYPIVVKTASGHGGSDVYWIESADQRENLTQLADEQIIIQEPAGQPGKDLRVFVIGKEIVGAVLRTSDTDFRANFSLGGQAAWYPLAAEEKSLVERIIQAYDFDFVGIDFLFDSEGKLLFNELEDVVGSRTLSQVSDVNIVSKYLSYISDKLEAGQ